MTKNSLSNAHLCKVVAVDIRHVAYSSNSECMFVEFNKSKHQCHYNSNCSVWSKYKVIFAKCTSTCPFCIIVTQHGKYFTITTTQTLSFPPTSLMMEGCQFQIYFHTNILLNTVDALK